MEANHREPAVSLLRQRAIVRSVEDDGQLVRAKFLRTVRGIRGGLILFRHSSETVRRQAFLPLPLRQITRLPSPFQELAQPNELVLDGPPVELLKQADF